jgi:N-dimethylarginine dimethylaminohydrolase
MALMRSLNQSAAYGGSNWRPRTASMRDEIGPIWRPCGVDREWSRLKAVLLHRPGSELEVADPDAALMLERVDSVAARAQHDALAEAYRKHGVEVHYLEPAAPPPPNQLFLADLFFMTPEGAILGRPAGLARAGEERWVARRLADLGIPILRSVGGSGTFEGADAAWLDGNTVALARGLRTNATGAAQVASVLEELGVEVVLTELPFGTMHLMGQLRFLDRDLAIAWHGRLAHGVVAALRDRGFEVLFFPDETESLRRFAHNFVTLGPRQILMPDGCPVSQRFYEEAGVECVLVEVDELLKAAGGIGCLSGILWRV